MQTIHQSGFFLKANSSIIGPSQNVVIRHPDRRTDEEVELAVVIGRRAQAVPAAEALDYVGSRLHKAGRRDAREHRRRWGDDGARSRGIKLKYKLRIAYPTPPFFRKCSF